MIIYDKEGTKLLTFTPDDTSFRQRAIKGDHTLTLRYSRAEHLELPRGAWCEYEGERFELLSPEAIKMHHSRRFEYTVTFEARQARLKLWKLHNHVDGRLRFPLTATPREHLEMLVANLNERDAGWEIGDCIVSTEKLISYDHNSCWDALAKMAQEFNTEWEIEGQRISLHKVERNKNNPLTLAYGMGYGFKSGVGRTSSGKVPTEVLYVQGGERNIDPSKYGSKTLHMPRGMHYKFDGTHMDGESGYDYTKSRHYVVDEKGLSIRRADKPLSTGAEESISLTEIYPRRVGEITSVVVVDPSRHFYDIIDSTIPETLDFEQKLIAGEKMTIIFQTGQLAGREFEVRYHHRYNTISKKDGRRFEIIPQEIDGVTMPSENFAPKVGDKYAVFHVMLPEEYLSDDTRREGAEWELLHRAVRYLWENEEQKYTFTGELDGIWAKRDWENIGGRIGIGSYIEFVDKSFAKDGVLLRIVGVKDFVNNPHAPILELSNDVVSAGFSGGLMKIKDDEALTEEYHRKALEFTKRRFRDAKETAEMIVHAALDGFSDRISPVAVQTMQLIVGDESLQFRFVDSREMMRQVNHSVAFDTETKELHIEAGLLQHMTYGIDRLSSSHTSDEYHFWNVPEFTSGILDNPDKRYYVYARVETNGEGAEFRLETEAKRIDSEDDHLWLLLGILNSENGGARSFASMYGYTEVLPGQIRTDRIATPDGHTYIDLVNGEVSSPRITFIHPDGAKKPYPADYLHQAIHEGTTEIRGGVVLGTLIGAKDTSGKIRSYISGITGKPALAAGVTGLEEGKETYQTAIHHDGSADFGYFHIRHPQGQGAAGSHLYLENYRYKDSPEIENPYAVKIGDAHPDLKVISRGKVTEDVVVSLPEIKLTGLYGRSLLFQHIAPGTKEVAIIIQPKDLGRYVTATSKVDVNLTFIGRVNFGNTERGFLAVSASPYPSYPVYSPEVRLSSDGGSYSFSGNVNPDGTLSFYLLLRGDYVNNDSQLNVRADIRVTTDSRRDRGTYLTQSGFLVFHDANNYINADRSRLPYVDAVSGAIRNAGNVMLEVAGGLRVKGAMDTSGTLLGGRVNPYGSVTFDHIWGVKASTARVERIARGMYKVTHNFGHTRYSVVCNGTAGVGNNASYVDISDNYFTVRTHHPNGHYDDIPFSFIVVGDNY